MDLLESLGHLVAPFGYPFLLTMFSLTVYVLINGKLSQKYSVNVARIRKIVIKDAVPTESPIADQEKRLKRSALDRLEERFSLMNKSLPFLLFVIWLIGMTVPYLDRVPTAYVTIIAAVISLIAGFSLRPFLENLFAGVVVAFFRSVRIGDTVVIDDHYGLIEEIGVTHSVLKRWDWHRIVIPNSKLLQKEIQNLTLNDEFIWAHVEFFVSPESDLSQVENLAVGAATMAKGFSGAEAPAFWVMGMEKDAIKCWVAAWANSPGEAWSVRNEIRTQLVKAFQAENIKLHSLTLNHLADKIKEERTLL